MSKRMLLNIALDCDTLLTGRTHTSAPRKHHHCRRRTYPSHGTHDKSVQSIMKCDDDMRKDLHGSVMLFNGTDALQGIGERMTKDQDAV